GLHFDDRAVAICQLAGAKRWWHGSAPAVMRPRCNLVSGHEESERLFRATHPELDVIPPELNALCTTELVPDALLYLPAGTWHRTSAQGSSLALTIRFLPKARALVSTRVASKAPLSLGILDACGGTDATLWETIELAQRADALGFHRYWL